ncbi:putative membrane protein [Citrobacter rodentium ICC168]|uniref:Membrane protein n=1 Tax=Citrobacter rodentium (strain ICC168) TaxID=637910 RepID=D2TST5_CITRI|nr:putative membrane protein [Citrobacter rodentium ICC168]
MIPEFPERVAGILFLCNSWLFTLDVVIAASNAIGKRLTSKWFLKSY